MSILCQPRIKDKTLICSADAAQLYEQVYHYSSKQIHILNAKSCPQLAKTLHYTQHVCVLYTAPILYTYSTQPVFVYGLCLCPVHKHRNFSYTNTGTFIQSFEYCNLTSKTYGSLFPAVYLGTYWVCPVQRHITMGSLLQELTLRGTCIARVLTDSQMLSLHPPTFFTALHP